ncbi:MAG: winged helix-turn-helix transcriptional regulator [Chloroflexia bacterium]|jgi:DNA-binding transcriptional ArsR family regulator|nr:winged helix-turn-helix transcriptional regulator [Chloroflexia bacterium]
MGELVAGSPALRITTAVSLPLNLVSILSLLYRAVPGSELDPWLIATRRALPPDLREAIDLLHGFSGRLLYYVEEPVMRFHPLRTDQLDATFDDLMSFLEQQPAVAYQAMAAHALRRVHHDLGRPRLALAEDDATSWRRALEPALTTAYPDDLLPLFLDPARLKACTIRLFQELWEGGYRDEYAAALPVLDEAARLGAGTADRGFGLAFADLTGSRPPGPLIALLADTERVVFCPSLHIGSFISYIHYPPALIVFYDARGLINRVNSGIVTPPVELAAGGRLGAADLIEPLRALADPTRLRIIDLLAEGELYAQEIVNRLGIAQSAVSRHLAQLERSGVVAVRAKRGMKYYAVNPAQLDALAAAIRQKGDTVRSVA